MFEHFEKYPWVMKQLQYADDDVHNLVHAIVKNCEERHAAKSIEHDAT
jgi:hypothetical protein